MTTDSGQATRLVRSTGPRLALFGCVALAVVIRIAVLLSPSAQLNGDEAVTGLMVRQILDGRRTWVYFAGQSYNGSLEQYLQAGMYALLRLPQNPFTLRLVEVAIAAATVVATYALARLVLPGAWLPVLAAALFAAGPYWNVADGTRSYGSYACTQLLAVLGLVCALRASGVTQARTHSIADTAVSARWAAGFGLCTGLALWLGWSGFEVLAVAGLWLLPSLVRSVRCLAAALAAVAVGALPAIGWSLHHHHLPGLGGRQPQTTMLHRLALLYRDVGGEYVGLGGPGDRGGFPVLLQHVVIVVLILAWLSAVALRRRGVLAVLTLRAEHRRPIDAVLLVVPVAILLYGSSRYAWYIGEPRYLFVTYPVAAVLIAGLLGTCAGLLLRLPAEGGTADERPTRPSYVTASARVLALLVVLAGATVSTHFVYEFHGNTMSTSDANLRAADRYLAAHGDFYVYADYWTALPAQYLATDPRLHIAPWKVGATKSPVATAAVNGAPTFSAYMTSSRTGADDSPRFLQVMAGTHVHFHVVHIGSVTIVDQLRPAIRPWHLPL